MKAGIILLAAIAAITLIANEIGNYASDINPDSPEDYPLNDSGDDF